MTIDHGQVVFVVDDDEAVRDSVAMLLASAGLVCETYDSALAFLGALDACPARAEAGCIVLDVRMPGMSGLELQRELNSRHVGTPIVFVTGYGDVPMAVEAMKRGAADFIAKPFAGEELIERVRAAVAASADQRAASQEIASIRERAATLSPREREVFERVAAGQANKVVAIDLGVSERTVEIHRSRVMKKMGARNLASLVRMSLAFESGGLTPSAGRRRRPA